LVDRRTALGVPLPASLDETSDSGVHEPDLLHAADSAAARFESANRHGVENHLCGLEDPALRVGQQSAVQPQHLDALGAGIRFRQRRAVERRHDRQAVLLEKLLPHVDLRTIGPVRQSGR
jgi:hypothetical protein